MRENHSFTWLLVMPKKCSPRRQRSTTIDSENKCSKKTATIEFKHETMKKLATNRIKKYHISNEIISGATRQDLPLNNEF